MTALLAFRPRHRPGGWSPKELGTLSLWLDADDATTITIATGVSQWDDKSGNGYNFTQTTGSQQPSYVKGAQNGRAVLRFDGSNDSVGRGDTLDILGGSLTVVAGFKNNAPSRIIGKTSVNPDANGEWTLSANTGDVVLGGVAVATAQSPGTTTSKIAAWVVDRSASSTIWFDGTQKDQDTGSPFPNTTSYDTAANLRIGQNDGGTTAWLNGDLWEVIVSLTALSTDDRQKCEGYLAHKWGLTGNLPADHPYKSIAP